MSSRPDSLRHWEYFVTVAEEGGVTAAADRLGVTQSPVSQGLKKLEDILGVELIKRTATGAIPTAAGRRLLPQARTLVRDAALLRQMADSAAPSDSQLRLGLASSIPAGIAYRLVTELDGAQVSSGSDAELVAAVGDGQLDAAVLEDPAPTGELRRGQLHTIARVLVGVDKHPSTWSRLSGRVLLDNTGAVSPAAAGRLADAFFTLGLSPVTEPYRDLAQLGGRLAAGDAMAVLPAGDCPGLPAITLPEGFELRLRTVIAPRRPGEAQTSDHRDTVDRALRNAIRAEHP